MRARGGDRETRQVLECARLLTAAVLLLCAPTLARGQTQLREDFDITDRPVHALARSGDLLYLGGEFTRVGPATGSSAALDLVTGRALLFPRPNGYITDIEPDGEGGWFVAGSFDWFCGLPRRNLVHVRSDLTVSPWDARMDPGSVSSIARVGTTLYVGGDFTTVGGAARRHLAAVSTVTALATPWNPQPNHYVFEVVVHEGTVYVGGLFTTIGGAPRFELAAVSAATGLATAWNPQPAPGSSYNVMALAVQDSVVYVGGNFLGMGGSARARLAAIHAGTGEVLPWNPGANQRVETIVPRGGTILVGGRFTEAGGAARRGLVALDRETGGALEWNPSPGPEPFVSAMEVDGSTLYVGGAFDSIAGTARSSIAAVDLVTGEATGWDPGCNGAVLALARSGPRIFAGGFFELIGAEHRDRIAALDVQTGRVTDWNPGADDVVRAMTIDGSRLYVGGSFKRLAGVKRRRLAAFDTATGAVLDWHPDADASVRAIAVAGSSVYAGGTFTRIGGLERERIAEIDATSAAATAWNPGADSTVRALAVGDGCVYAGGSFTRAGGAPRGRIAALDRATGAATAWNADVGGVPHPDVYALLASGTRVLAAGDFATIAGTAQAHLAALDVADGSVLPWGSGLDFTCYALATDGVTVYAAGSSVRALDAATGTPDSWRLFANPVQSLAVDGSTVYLGGGFRAVDGAIRYGVAALAGVPTATTVSLFVAESTGRGVALRWRLSGDLAEAWIDRAPAATGPWTRMTFEIERQGEDFLATDEDIEEGETRYYRIVVESPDGRSTFGPIVVTAGVAPPEFALLRVSPSPASGPVRVEFSLAHESSIRLDVLDLQGRRVATLVDGAHRAGRHHASWSGESDRGPVPAGVYFVRYQAAGRVSSRRIVLSR